MNKLSLKIPTKFSVEFFQKVRDLYNIDINKIQKGLDDLVLPEGTAEINDLSTSKAYLRLHQVIDTIIAQIFLNGRPTISVPSRSTSNIIWDEINDLLLMGQNTSSKALLSLTSTVDVTRLMRVLEIINELLMKRIHATKREVYYADPTLFNKDQRVSDGNIEDATALMYTTRNSTHIVASAKGNAVGSLVIRDDKEIIDLERLGKGGWSISPMLDDVEFIETDAEFVLVVEKDAAMIRLAEAKWWKKFPCIILTGKGMADMATRIFLKRISKELGLPVFGLCDSDAYGFQIMSVFKKGSKKLSYESPFLACQDLHLLGLLPSDLNKFNISDAARIKLDTANEKKAKQMLKEEYIPKTWKNELEIMLKMKQIAEIQALSSKGFEYLTEEYLPTKLSTGDWI